jgi:hypothetical protein
MLRMKWWIYRDVKDEEGGELKPIKTTAKKRGLFPMYSVDEKKSSCIGGIK